MNYLHKVSYCLDQGSRQLHIMKKNYHVHLPYKSSYGLVEENPLLPFKSSSSNRYLYAK
ncbi:hypothetical protein KML001_50760 [Klebsiella quasipneumoniae subsp. similipneumoniae]|nr:hypothetical protein KML001_50760 [Klebsiella quasipneumoniae subsp. similipneumoniae]